MDLHEFLEHLRRTTQEDVNPPIMSAELLDLFNCIVDIRSAEDDAAAIEDEARIAATHKS